ncbi:hypothetical protein RO3G_10444 [Lichtheimia corymbifera JMRC:FSU:9682]|uniref:Ataxin-10 homolog n=1 Tax=Lichtheimia corymbifera JMRC:FSU:9682 TaxID=1263082 RepID=A0A068SBN3_9FUNG|nr:hypothetical protein RO3G_10444 [Lichtheimia corymbifera JMRC:FSU:9682]
MLSVILQHLDRYLADANSHPTLEAALTAAVKRTVNEPDLRSEIGHSNVFWRLTCLALTALYFDRNAEESLIALLKLARNVTAGDQMSQQLAIIQGALVETENIIRYRDRKSPVLSMTVVQVGVQAICNFITGNPIALESIWEDWMQQQDRGTIFSDLLAVNDDTVVMSTMVLILNCISNSPERCKIMIKSIPGQKMVAAILDDLERLHNDEKSKNFELGYTILSQLIDEGHFTALYDCVKGSNGQMNSRQTRLLKVLDSKVHRSEQQQQHELPSFIHDTDLECVASLVNEFSKEAVQAFEQAKSGDGKVEMDNVSELYTGLVLVLQLSVSLLTMQDQGHFREMLVEKDTMGNMTNLLRCCETMSQPGFNYLKRDSVRLMGTLCYHDRRMQDKIRETGGIPLVLAQCKIDDANPYLREHAVLAIRHMLQDNDENQTLIAEMEPLQAVQTDDLSDMGLTARLENGKVKLSKKKTSDD